MNLLINHSGFLPTATIPITHLLCSNRSFLCRTAMVPVDVVIEIIKASRSIAEILAGAKMPATLLNVFTSLVVLGILATIGTGLVEIIEASDSITQKLGSERLHVALERAGREA